VNNQEFPIVESSPILVDLLNQIRRMENERVELLQVIASLRAERDEARREACGCNEYIDGAMLEADRRGWDCYKDYK